MPVTTNTRKLAALLGASGAGIGTDGLLQAAGVDANIATQAEMDAGDNKISTNLAVLAIRRAADHNDVKYSLQDRIIDTYYDASGIDGTPSTNHVLTSGVYSGKAGSTPSVTFPGTSSTGTDGDYSWYKWTVATSQTISTDTTQDYQWLVVGGGAAGGINRGTGGGGAGGFRTGTTLTLAASVSYTVTVGAGGAGHSDNSVQNAGGLSLISGSGITTITAAGGGGGGNGTSGGTKEGAGGGSGGGGGSSTTNTGDGGAATAITQLNAGSGASAHGETTTVQGYAGGDGPASPVTGQESSGGGGGASEVGESISAAATGGDGGDGIASTLTGSSVTYAGGGGGGANGIPAAKGLGGAGGGGDGRVRSEGNGNAGSGTDGTGGGGGGHVVQTITGNSGSGGTGAVVLRRITSSEVYNNMTLQSTDTAAETEADYADMVTLIEDTGGTPAVINTDIKGFISEDSGVTFTEGVLVDEGDWGTNKRILAFHDLDISAQSGTAMCYKITTHNQSASKETKIHATSIGWR